MRDFRPADALALLLFALIAGLMTVGVVFLPLATGNFP